MGFIKTLWPILLANNLLQLEPNANPVSFAEAFAGDHAWSRGMQFMGFEGRSFDMRFTPAHNFMRPAGFLALVATVMCMHKGAVLWLGTPCSTWVWMSRWSTGRSATCIIGNVSSAYIRAQNALISRVCYIIVLAMKRGVYWIIEQPMSSIMWSHPLMERVLTRFGDQIDSVTADMGSWSLETLKPSVFKGTAPYLKQLGRRANSCDREVLKYRINKVETMSSYIDKKGKKRSAGTAELKGTQSYSLNFGAAHALAYHETCLHEVQTALPGNTLNPDDSEEEPLVNNDNSLDDIRLNKPDMWHDNAAGEQQLQLKCPRH